MIKIARTMPIVVIATIGCLLCCAGEEKPAEISETVLVPANLYRFFGLWTVSRDKQHFAWLQGDKDKQLMVDGKPIGEPSGKATWEMQQTPVWSADGRRIACIRTRINKKENEEEVVEYAVVVYDVTGKSPKAEVFESQFYPKITLIRLSSDGEHVAFVVEEQGRSFVCVDSKKQVNYEALVESTHPDRIQFSPDGKTVAYGAIKSSHKRVVVKNGVESKEYANVDMPQFSPDGKLVYVANDGANYVLIVDEKPVTSGWTISTPVFSADGKKMAYRKSMRTDDVLGTSQETVMLNDKIVKSYTNKSAVNLRLSPDGSCLSYFVYSGGRNYTFVFNGKEHAPIKRLHGVECHYSPDGKRFIYFDETDGKGKEEDYKQTAIVDGVVQLTGKRGSQYAVFSPDSKHYAYACDDASDNARIVRDGKASQPCHATGAHMFFSSDSEHLIYLQQKDRKSVLTFDTVEVPVEEYANKRLFSSTLTKEVRFISMGPRLVRYVTVKIK